MVPTQLLHLADCAISCPESKFRWRSGSFPTLLPQRLVCPLVVLAKKKLCKTRTSLLVVVVVGWISFLPSLLLILIPTFFLFSFFSLSENRLAKMHASNLLKAVLKPRSLSSTTSSGKGQSLTTTTTTPQQNDVVSTKGKRNISSPDFPNPSASVIAKKSSHHPSSPPAVKMVCLCSPTNHPGSFRCRLHRAEKALRSSASSSKAASSSAGAAPPPTAAALYPSSSMTTRAAGMRNLEATPSHNHLAKSPPGRTSRLNRMVANAQQQQSEEDTGSNNNHHSSSSSSIMRPPSASHISMADSSSSSGEIYSEYCQSTSKKAMDIFDRNRTRMYL